MRKNLPFFIIIICLLLCCTAGVSADAEGLEFSAAESSSGNGYTWTVDTENSCGVLALSWAELTQTLIFPAELDKVTVTLDGISSIDVGDENCIEALCSDLIINGEGVLDLRGYRSIFANGNISIQNGYVRLYNTLQSLVCKGCLNISGGYIEAESNGSGFDIAGNFNMSDGTVIISLETNDASYCGMETAGDFSLSGGWLELTAKPNSKGIVFPESDGDCEISGGTLKIIGSGIGICGKKTGTNLTFSNNSICLIESPKQFDNITQNGTFSTPNPFPETPLPPEVPHQHSLTHHEAKAATCTEEGYKAYDSCSGCDYTTYEKISALGHDYAVTVTKPACTELGYTTYECSRCHDTYIDTYVSALGHDWDKGVVTKEATCTEEGVKTYTCIRCKEIKTESIPKLPAPTQEPFVNPFTDVKENDYFYSAVLWGFQNKIVSGTSDVTFSPKNPTTRGQMITFLWRLMNCPEPKGVYCPFNDVKSGAYYSKAVLWGYEKGYVAGVSASSFSPDSPVTRSQSVTFLARINGVRDFGTDYKSGFKDVKANAYYANAVGWAMVNGIVAGVSETHFAPDNSCRRCDMVCILYRWQNQIK